MIRRPPLALTLYASAAAADPAGTDRAEVHAVIVDRLATRLGL